MQNIISVEETHRMLFMEEMIDENDFTDHVEEEEEMEITPMNYFCDDDVLNQIIASLVNESEDEATEKSLSLAQKLKRKPMGIVEVRKGLTVDSGAADHATPIGWLLMFLVVKLLGSIRGLHYVAADGTRIPNVGQRLVKFMTLDGTWTEIPFQIAAIHKALVSVSKLDEAGYKVIFDDDNSNIMHKKTRKVIKMEKEKGECSSSTPTCPRDLRQV